MVTYPKPSRITDLMKDLESNSTLVETNANEFEIDAEAAPPARSPLFSRGVQLYCLAMLCGSLMKACSKMLVEQLDIFVVLLARMAITSVLSVAALRYLGVPHSFWGERSIRVLLFIRGGLGFFNIVSTYFALQYLSLPDLAVISFLTPLATSIGARIFLKEQYVWQQAVASLVSLMGVVVIARPPWLLGRSHKEEEDPAKARLAAIRTFAVISSIVVVITASAVMIILRKIRERAHALTSVANYAVLSVVGSFIALTVKSSWALPQTWKQWLMISLMGMFGFMLQFLSSKAIQMEEATVLSNFKYTQLLYATTLEFVFWHDVPDLLSFVGMALILAGVLSSARFKQRKQEEKSGYTKVGAENEANELSEGTETFEVSDEEEANAR